MHNRINGKVNELIKRSLEEAYVDGFLQNLIEIVVLSVIYFYIVGYYTNEENLKYFIAAYFLITVLVIPVEAIHGARNTLIKKISEMQNGSSDNLEESVAAFTGTAPAGREELKDPWALTAPSGLIVGGAGAAVAYFAVAMLENATHVFWAAMISVFVAVSVCTTVSIHIHFRRYAPNLAQVLLRRSFGKQEDIGDYAVERHILPWGFILAVLSLLISHKTFSEFLYVHASISVSNAAFSTASSCYVMMIWMWYVSQLQVRGDVRLGWVHMEGDTSLSSSDVMFLIHVAAAMVVGLVFLVGFIFGLSEYSLMQAMIFHLIMVVVFGVAGNVLGILWGYDREKR